MGKAFEGIGRGLNEAIGHAKGEQILGKRIHVGFTEEDLRVLKGLDITDAQVFCLKRSLPLIAYDLSSLPRMEDVRDKLSALHRTLMDADNQLTKMAAQPGHSIRTASREAFLHLGLAAARREEVLALAGFGDAKYEIPSEIDVAILVKLSAASCALALSSEAPTSQRKRRTGADAIKRIADALERPADTQSRLIADRLKPSRTEGSGFHALCEQVFRAACATGSPSNAIRAYLSRQKTPGG